MDSNSLSHLKDPKEKSNLLLEVANIEKQLLGLIHAKGLLHSGVQDYYRKICSGYEKIILSDHELGELQDVEYSLWKLHYRHIDEFRKRTKRSSVKEETSKSMTQKHIVPAERSIDNHTDGFKSFLSEATELYQNLMVKIKRRYRLPEDFSFNRSGIHSGSIEPKKLQKVQFLCHRFLVCLGDLARYREQCEKSDSQNHNWSVAVTHYLNATMIWPDSGNPQNQLAVLATYVGDDLLALYHCIRSLAVKEPFPDAWNNLILLFERNRSYPLRMLSSEAHFDFSKPSEGTVQSKLQSTINPSNCNGVKDKHEEAAEANLWPLFIRMISFFFIKSSLENFPCAFASAIKELNLLMVLDDEELNATMQSYQNMNLVRVGPFRALQVASVFVFVIENLINSSEVKESQNKSDGQQIVLVQQALTATFIFMGRLADRCLKSNSLSSCPLLPALLVFVEWLVKILAEAEKYVSDDKSTSALCYFFGAFVELLNRLGANRNEADSPVTIALWEDYELRGFAPLACCHSSLDYSTHPEHADNFQTGQDSHAHRMISAAMKISERSNKILKLIIYDDKSGRKFSVPRSDKSPYMKGVKMEATSPDVEVKESHQQIQNTTEAGQKLNLEEKLREVHSPGKSVQTEEEEVILFRPLTRFNSAPLYSKLSSNNQMSPKDTGDNMVPADECLRRATSLLIAQNQAQGDASAFHSDLTNFRRNRPLKQQGSLLNDLVTNTFAEAPSSPGTSASSSSISAGPPSLNAWVLDRGTLSNDRAKGNIDVAKRSLTPIEEITCASLDDLSISETSEGSVIGSVLPSVTGHYSSPAYSSPVPSAPLLPDDAIWLNGVQSSFSDYNGTASVNRMSSVFDPSQVNGYSNWTGAHQPLDYGPPMPALLHGYPPLRRMTSSEWLRQYRENQNLERANSHIWPVHSYAAGNTGNYLGHDISRPGLYDQWGSPLASSPLIYEESRPLYPGLPPVYSGDEYRRDKLFNGYQRASPYVCGAVNEPEPLLQYLKEKEWLLQQDPTLRGPTYMGS